MLAATAQQIPVSAVHGGDGVPNEADRLAADGRHLPLTDGDGAGPVESLRDLAIACAIEMTVERAHHQDEALAEAAGDRPSAWNGT